MPPEVRRVVLLGSTGSVGTQTLDVIDRLSQKGFVFSIIGLAAGRQIDRLGEQIKRYRPLAVCVAEEAAGDPLRRKFPSLKVFTGEGGVSELSRLDNVDLVVNAMVGAIGLDPTLQALSLGRTVALANKESLVVGGELVQRCLEQDSDRAGRILPLDSEHSALFQCLKGSDRSEVSRLVLTASGGPFLHVPKARLSHVTPEEALHHPNWTMGRRITIDSATMANKAFEVIEAHYLFSVPYEKIDVVIHPESIVHSFVEYQDGSVLAQLALPDMRIPIQYALTYPGRVESDLSRLAIEKIGKMTFEPLNPEDFPAFSLVFTAAQYGGTAPAAINAADEVLIERFLEGEISFTGIAQGLKEVLSHWVSEASPGVRPVSQKLTLGDLRAADAWARRVARGRRC
jgi:1-deoxy-D-xylulose-5-phosphate reductoisomerase